MHLPIIRQHHAGDIRVRFQKILNRVRHQLIIHKQILDFPIRTSCQVSLGGKPLIIHPQPLHICPELHCGIVARQ